LFFITNYIIHLINCPLLFLTYIEVKSNGGSVFCSNCPMTSYFCFSVFHVPKRCPLRDSCKVWAISITEIPNFVFHDQWWHWSLVCWILNSHQSWKRWVIHFFHKIEDFFLQLGKN
jgi:hypothetical protein